MFSVNQRNSRFGIGAFAGGLVYSPRHSRIGRFTCQSIWSTVMRPHFRCVSGRSD
jgi:hypothetical protein